MAAPLMRDGNVIDGKAVAALIREEITSQVTAMKAKHKRVGWTY